MVEHIFNVFDVERDGNKMKWKDIPGYENVYECSPCGIIRRKENKRKLSYTKVGYGYLTVRLSNLPVKRERPYVHHVVMNTFGEPKPFPKFEIDHIDRDKTNNCISNLRWVTHQENCMNRDNMAIVMKGLKTRNG